MLIKIEYLGTDGQVYIATAEVYESSEAKALAQAVLNFESSFAGVAHILNVKNVTLGAERNWNE